MPVEKMMIDQSIKSSVVNDKEQPILCDPLFDAALRFNLFPSEYVHPSWLDMLDKVLPCVFSANEMNATDRSKTAFETRSLSRVLLTLCHADGHFDFDFSDQAKRVALLPHDALMSLGMQVSAILTQSHLQKIVMNEKIHAINQAIGEDIRLFCLHWPVEGHLMPAALGELGNAIATHLFDANRFQWCAIRLVHALIPADETAVSRRLSLKYPVRWRRIKPFNLNPQQRNELSALFIAVLKKKWPGLFQLLWGEAGAHSC